MRQCKNIYLFLIFFSLALSFLPVSADCSDKEANDLDKDCTSSCSSGSENEIKGCYLPPKGGTCPKGYKPHETSEICCCKS